MAIEAQIADLETHAAEKLQKEQSLIHALKTNRDLYLARQRELNVLEAEISSLEKIQQTMKNGNNETALTAWLKEIGLENGVRIWQSLSIKKGWESALEECYYPS